MAPTALAKAGLMLRFFIYMLGSRISMLKQAVAVKRVLKHQQQLSKRPDKESPRNIVIVGASFAGYEAARVIATSLPEDSPYRVVVIEPSSHFHFTWILPRVCVVEGHEHKALIPYGSHLKGAVRGRLRWVTGGVTSVSRDAVRLEGDDGEVIPYAYLVVATGASAGDGLPSRVPSPRKEEGLERIRSMQRRIAGAKRIVVVGGGAAGVELATDAKHKYPDKHVMLVHSRPAVMHRFGPELQAAALKGLEDLGVEVLLNERAAVDAQGRLVTLRSGTKIECDLYVSCVGQRPSSHIIAELSPAAILESGHIRVKPTLQIGDESLPNIYACGDVADTGMKNPNGRAAMMQGMVVGYNIGLAISGEEPSVMYDAHWADAMIKLTLGLDKSIMHFGDEETEFLWHTKEKDVALMADGAWEHMGAKPFKDDKDLLAQYRQAI
ncbi:hypothetical protein GGTG_13286 [Gaeumannomyces tritici R3-111a-1]|uniref:FAD/NAD(P)-binding domain-containing protein n=1 Tax=Gaeumannomyces tritici (strain R3-111a-1) TaxID=644352 RepID=J3PIF8_GAET3|nr:hypothetical protein GGTG_13286 [Gaeumannomyces tritici R3-111a-1]EJT69177.1 hypothetical protein GGTG_13286 [Gaeumannomyces tritici R3-111a-1]